MKVCLMFDGGKEYQQLDEDCVLCFWPGEDDPVADDPRDRPEEDVVTVRLLDVAKAVEPLAAEVLELRLEVFRLRDVASKHGRAEGSPSQ